MIKLYFNRAQLKNKLNSNSLVIGNYLLIDIKYIQKIKEFFDYSILEKELNNNEIAKQSMDLLEKSNKNEHNILNDKKISIIIKNLPEEINTNYNNKQFNNKEIEYKEMPNLIPFNSTKLFYYDNFEIIDIISYSELFWQSINFSLIKEKENYLECIFIEK